MGIRHIPCDAARCAAVGVREGTARESAAAARTQGVCERLSALYCEDTGQFLSLLLYYPFYLYCLKGLVTWQSADLGSHARIEKCSRIRRKVKKKRKRSALMLCFLWLRWYMNNTSWSYKNILTLFTFNFVFIIYL